MSLLMDALKKAELAKRQVQAEGARNADTSAMEPAADAGGMAIEPLTLEPSLSAPNLPAADRAHTPSEPPADSSLQLEALDEAFLAEIEKTSQQSHTATSGHTPMTTQTAAQNLFAAKQPAAAQKKSFALVLGGLTAVAVVAIGAYFWWQLQPRPPGTGLAMNPPAAVPPQPSILPATPVQPITALPPAASTPVMAPSDQPADAEEGGDDQATHRPSRPTAIDSPDQAIVRLTKAPLRVDPSLMRGYEAFNHGDLAAAQAEYSRALEADPRNTDAMHGLAAIASRRGQLDQAAAGYQKILEANPQDPIALAALINIRSQMDPAAAESRLKMLAAAQPELAAPDFSLGNLYAKQSRWNEAQQAYFRAYSAEPENPDILYNLAISLEHIHQSRLAAQYYAQALAAAQTRPAGFDKAQAAARLHALQP